MSERKIRKPVPQGVAKVPVVMQLEALECGAASLAMVLAYYDKWITLEQARLDCGVSRDGSNLKNIMLAARNYGLEAKAYRLEPEDLLEEGPFPCIIHWGFNHFLVLDGFKGKKAVLNDPARGHVEVSWEEFDREFTGICMMLEPGEGFEPSGHRKSMTEYAKARLKGTGAAVAFVVLTTIISSLLGMIQPGFQKFFIDRLLSGSNPEWLNPFMLGMSLLCIVTLIISWISTVYSMRIQGKMAAVGNSSYLWRVLRLPMKFFGQRMAGDIAERQAANASISGALVNTFAPLAIHTAVMVFYLVVMLSYSVVLTAIGVGSILIDLILSYFISKKRINITRVQMRDAAKLSGATIAGIDMIETIKASGAEEGYFRRWAGFQASVNTQQVKFQRMNYYIGLLPEIVKSLAGIAVMGIGFWLVIEQKFTPGSVMAFQGFMTAFLGPASSLIQAGQSFQEMITQMERVDDVMSYPIDDVFEAKEEVESYDKLSGHVIMKDVTFGYAPLGAPLITNFNMEIKPGQRIAFVGQSGCGKSTLAKLLTGLYQPWSGEIRFDGKPLQEINRDVFTGSVAVVNQEVTLFDDSISDNIKMWDQSIEDFEVIMAARDAGIHDDIVQRDGGYRHKLLEGGRDLSGGQRQRVEIARALAQDPTICILDEATSALDAKTESEVVKSISERGITCIVIAHRLSTIRDCDEIIVLDHGQVVERGTHKELIALNGAYTRLVTSE